MELVEARAESHDLKEKLGQAKTRTKKLTEILMQAKMRETTGVVPGGVSCGAIGAGLFITHFCRCASKYSSGLELQPFV